MVGKTVGDHGNIPVILSEMKQKRRDFFTIKMKINEVHSASVHTSLRLRRPGTILGMSAYSLITISGH